MEGLENCYLYMFFRELPVKCYMPYAAPIIGLFTGCFLTSQKHLIKLSDGKSYALESVWKEAVVAFLMRYARIALEMLRKS
jgi:hypothetical protein